MDESTQSDGKFGDDENDLIYNNITDQIAEAKDTLDEVRQLEGNKNLQEKLLLQDVKIKCLNQTLDMKEKQLQELNELLTRKKTVVGQLKNQRSQNFDGKSIYDIMMVGVRLYYISMEKWIKIGSIYAFCVHIIRFSYLKFVTVVAALFKDTKKFTSKAGHEITQTFTSLGFDIEYDRMDDHAVVQVRLQYYLSFNDKNAKILFAFCSVSIQTTLWMCYARRGSL